MKRMLLAGAMLLATMSAALAAEGINLTPVIDYAINAIFGVFGVLAAWVAYQVDQRFKSQMATDIVRRVMEDSLRLGEDRLREIARFTNVSTGNDKLDGIVGNILAQAPDEVRRLGYSELYIRQWAANRLNMAPAPTSEPPYQPGTQGLT